MIPLAGPANKQARIVANNICGRNEVYAGTMGTSIAQVFDLSVASTGSNEKALLKMVLLKVKTSKNIRNSKLPCRLLSRSKPIDY